MRAATGIAPLLAAMGTSCALAAALPVTGIPPGVAAQTVTVGGMPIEVETYRPARCMPRLVLLVFHGILRNAATYRDHARPLADMTCAVVVAPRFDATRFPTALYQRGGITAAPPGHRTVDLVPPLGAWARQAAGSPGLPLVLLGFSAGGQFLDRAAAFTTTGADAILIGSPSTWVLPSITIAAPYGLGDTERANDAALRDYLALPITVLLGTADTGSKYLAMGPAAMAQGLTRYQRGRNTFQAAAAVARSHGWKFGWTLAEIPDVGHDAAAVFASPQALAAVRRAVP